MDKEELTRRIENLLHREGIDTGEKLIKYGADSLFFSRLQVELKKNYGKKIPIKTLFANGCVDQLYNLLNEKVVFEMSDLQKAYVAGRKEEMLLGGYGSHAFFSFEAENLKPEQFKKAVQKLVEDQEMLRAVIETDETMCIEDKVEVDENYLDLQDLTKEEQEKRVEQEKERMFCKEGMLHFLQIQLEKEKSLVCVAHDGLIADGESHQIILEQMEAYCKGEPVREHVKYPDYVKYINELKKTEEYRSVIEDMKIQFADYDVNPILPFKIETKKIKHPSVAIECRKVAKEIYEKVSVNAMERGVTPFSLVLTIYGKAIGKYADNQKFLLNLPVAQRPTELEGIENLVGLCSNFMLVDFDNTCQKNIWKQIEEIQEKLFERRETASFLQGTDLLKELKRDKKTEEIASVVFTSTIGGSQGKDRRFTKKDTRTYTSQVWLEGLLTEAGDEILFTLSYPEELLDEFIPSGIADCFIETMELMSEQPELFEQKTDIDIPQKDQAIIQNANGQILLFREMLKKHSLQQPEKIAVIGEYDSYTYSELEHFGNQMGRFFKENYHLNFGEKVAIYMAKSTLQVAVELALAYLNIPFIPLDYEMPLEAVKECLDGVGIRYIFVDEDKLTSDFGKERNLVNAKEIQKIKVTETEDGFSAGEIFLMINTSGTTGKVKTVPLKQEAVIKCILDSEKIYGIKKTDIALQITNASHDMSLFDIFGMIYLGGSVVVPEQKYMKEPVVWAELICKYNVNVWNSVPTFMEMFLLEESNIRKAALKQLRVIIQGGDYLQISVAESILNSTSDCRLFNVGGPTETTIWNIYHEVTQEDVRCGVIPYGRTFPDTFYYILNENMQPCPIGKEGTMYIASEGVIEGYLGEVPEENCFTEYQGVRVYNSGDRGKYLPNGEILFCGRKDRQIKINGKRIELDGIEQELNRLPYIDRGVVIEKGKTIIAFYTSRVKKNEESVRSELRKILTSYMMPRKIFRLDMMPMSKNGKIDRKQLEERDIFVDNQKNEKAESSKLQQELLEIFQEILFEAEIGLEDDFYEMGGDSVSAMRIIAKIWEKFGIKISPSDVFENKSIRKLAKYIEGIGEMSYADRA
mgnify:FL=1